MIEWVCQHRRFSRSQSSHRLFVNICLFNSSVNPIVPGGSALEKRPSDISSTNGKSSGQADEARTALRSLDTFLNKKLVRKCLFKITARLLIEVPKESSSPACFWLFLVVLSMRGKAGFVRLRSYLFT